jgi:hypothetical protein
LLAAALPRGWAAAFSCAIPRGAAGTNTIATPLTAASSQPKEFQAAEKKNREDFIATDEDR